MGKIRERVIAYVLAFCTLVSAVCTGITMPVSAEEGDGTKGSITVTNYKIEVRDSSGRWVELTNDMTVRNGDEVRVSFDWALDDCENQLVDFDTVISPIRGITFGKTDEADLPHTDSDKSVGVYWIDGNVFHIKLTEEEFIKQQGNRHGGAFVTGTINVTDGQDGKKTEIQIGNTTVTPNFTTGEPTSAGYVNKWAKGNFVEVEGTGGAVYCQTYRLQISTQWNGGEIKNISIIDNPGKYLGKMSQITVVSCTGTDLFTAGQSFNDFEEINRILENQSLGSLTDGQTSIIFEYTMDIDAEHITEASKQNPGDEFKNTVTLNYTDNKGGSHSPQASANVKAARPTIEKSGTREGDYIIWTITLHLNGASLEDIDFIEDIPGLGLDEYGNTKEFTKEFIETNFTPREGEPGVYDYTYKTKITKEYLESTSGPTIKNDVKIHMKNEEVLPTVTGTYTLEADRNWVQKKVVGTQNGEEGFLINWEVTLTIPKDVVNIRLQDWPDNSNIVGQHEIYGDIWIAVGNEEKKLAVTNVSSDGYRGFSSGTCVAEDLVSALNGNGIYFNDSLAGKTVKVYYTTKVTDSSVTGKQYINRAQGFYSFEDSPNNEKSSDEASATWESRSALSKTGTAEGYTISYILKIDLTKIDFPKDDQLKDGDAIIIRDILPQELELDESVKVSLRPLYLDKWGNQTDISDHIKNSMGATGLMEPEVDFDVITEGGKNIIVFTIPVNSYLLKLAKLPTVQHFETCTPYLFINYTLKVEDAAKFVREGQPKEFTNSASGTFGNSSIGSTQTTTTLTPPSVVDKSGEYKEQSGFVDYKVEINKDALDLTKGDWLQATDKLGSSLSYDLNSIHVFEMRDGVEVELTPQTDYKYTYSLENNSLIFTLPDEKHLIIRYSTWVNLKPGAYFDDHNVSNTFTISGEGLTSMEAGETLKGEVSLAWAVGDTVTISLRKYYNNDGFMESLGGATFTIIEVEDNGGKLVEKPGGKSWTVIVDQSGSCIIGEGEYSSVQLERDRIYKLTETKAPNGYELREDPIYFLVFDQYTETKEYEEKGIIVLHSGAEIPCENFPEETKEEPEPEPGSLKIIKTVEGLAWNEANKLISFTVKGPDFEKTYEASELFAGPDESGAYSYTISPLEPGDYTVTENVEDKDGYSCITTYSVNVKEGGVEGNEASVNVAAGETREVYFTNDYETGRLTIQKTVRGDQDLAWETIMKGLSFKIYLAGEEEGEPVATIIGSDLVRASSGDGSTYTHTINLKPGQYTVKEIAAVEVGQNGKNYVLSEVTYEVGEATGNCTENRLVTPILVEKDRNIIVEFCNTYNTYEENVGTLVLQKSVTITQGTDGNAEPKDAWETVKGSLEFKIYAYNTQTSKYDKLIKTIDGNSLQWNSQTGVATKELPIEPGKYMVVETREDLNGYTWEKTSYIVTSLAKGELTKGESNTAEFELNRGDKITAAFTNEYSQDRGTLVITKTFEGDKLTEEEEGSIEFTIINEKTGQTVATYTLSKFLSKSPYRLELELPVGNYTVKETVCSVEGYITNEVSYTVNGSGKTFLIEDGGDFEENKVPTVKVDNGKETTVDYTDNYALPAPGQGTLTLKKTITGLEWGDVTGKLHFVIYKVNPEGGEEEVRNCTVSNVPNSKDQAWELTIPLDPGKYIVKEVWDGEVGISCTATYEVTENGISRQLDATADSAEVTITENGESEVAVKNDYVQEKGYLEITKTVDGVPDELAKENIVFTVTNNTTGEKIERTLSKFEYDESEQKYTWTLEANVGNNYKVEETYLIDGFITQRVSYKINTGTDIYLIQNGNTISTNAPTVSVNTPSQTVTVAYTNDYAKKPNLVLKKNVEGLTWDKVRDSISFTVTGPSYPDGITINASDFDEAHTYTFTNLIPGKYTITENVGHIENYECVTQYQNVNMDGDTPYVSLTAGVNSTVEIANTYTMLTVPPTEPDPDLDQDPDPDPKPSTSPSPAPSTPPPSNNTTTQPPASNSTQSAPAPTQPSPTPAPTPVLQVPPTPSPSKSPQEGGDVLSAERDRVPQTSDYFFMWLSLFLASLSSLLGYLSFLNKKNRDS